LTVAESPSSALLEQIRSGNRQFRLLAAEGVLPIPPEDLIPVQVDLAHGDDEEVAELARKSLRTVDARLARPFLERQAGPGALAFFAEESSHPMLLEAIVRRRDVPRPILVGLARRLPPDLQEVLLLRQDAIVEDPGILDALEENPQISTYTQRRIAEYREHLLPRERSVSPFHFEMEEMDDEALEAEIEAARELPPMGELEPERTKLTEGQIRGLSIPARLKLTRGAPRSLRNILLRDSNPQVAVSVIANNALSEQEIEQTAANRSVVEEVLAAIGKRREWVNKYNVTRALVHNPRAPLALTIRLVSKLSVRDLKNIGRDRNIPDALRSTALRLYRIKQQ
jgi:hypothetical protein